MLRSSTTGRPAGDRRCSNAALAAAALASAALWGCSSPMEREEEDALRESLLLSHRQLLGEVASGGIVRVTREPSSVEAELDAERTAELDRMSGLAAYENDADARVSAGIDLLGRIDEPVVQLPLERAIALAVERNLDLAAARLSPSITAAQLQQAEAAFDAEIFADVDFTKLDTPGPVTSDIVPGLSGDRRSETLLLGAGLRKRLAATNGTLGLESRLARIDDDPSLQGVSPFYDADLLVTLQQPLLRNFGREVATSEIVLARNAERAATERLRGTLIDLVDEVETAYWELLFSRQRLLIQAKLLERTITERDRLKLRQEFDASPVDVTEANSFVELRRLDVINAREAWRNASDRLKRLINAPELGLGDETLIVPLDRPVDAPIAFSLLDAVTTSLRHRPELQVALLSIADAGVRLTVADNQLLPQLDLSAQVGLGGVGVEDGQDAYDDLSEGDFVDYLVSLDFSYPLGNRLAEGLVSQRQLERQQSTLDYRRLAQDAVLEVKTALRAVASEYQRIGASRAARRAAANNLRAIRAQEDAGNALTPVFVDQKLRAQERLATAETQEAQSRSQYMVAISELYRSTGTLLDRNGIAFREPAAGGSVSAEALLGERAEDGRR
ncbi:TolC family protein [Phycisphaera mikurensis]|uniref:Putative efflux system outer membrane protein n=1 Tax=Phycisphaera mikurensis (strain NBRC 102666 / KCTC 22515 / FYK2301M01) TaxID=1142394 RepID=I0IFG3_PHYMF|nr:TolC family protein [Phycisphaera mikurensis]MBB6440607.1 outer membrane protein TolC [Phycisphaera mikurensis]BAM04001.1 putative efflux system outer membrane protein [Phycisphaera mikurensis NBRC 102666]